MQKKILTLLCISLLAAVSAIAQKRVEARDILREINAGHDVSYKDVEVVGVLDFTDLDNRMRHHSSSGLFGWFDDNDQYESTVEGSVSFINCTFSDDVLAYYHVERDNDTYIAHFEGDVIFTDCIFRRGSEFKYSEFRERADFSGSEFNREANFKYAEFSGLPSFAKAKFNHDANFKYAEFPRGADFESAAFYELANFKYTKFSTPLNMKNVKFEGDEDFKYTSVDGHSFTSYLLKNRD